MARDPKQQAPLETSAGEDTEAREVSLADGRTLQVGGSGQGQTVEIRSASGMLEVRIVLTEQGPVLQMASARLELKASEVVEIAAPKVAIAADTLEVKTKGDTTVDAEGEVRLVGKMIYLN